MTALTMYPYIILDGNKYAVADNTYNRKWQRAFSSQLAGNIIRLNFVDRGPGIRVYDMTLFLANWAPGSNPYLNGITQSWDTQEQNLEASYGKTATVLQFVDPMGLSPGPSAQYGVFFTNFNLIVPAYSTPQKPYLLAEIELTEATQVVA